MGAAGWQVVGYPDDPIPDNAGVIAAQIAHLRSVAANIATQVAALPQSGQVDALVWKSQDNDAPQQFRQQASQLPHDLDLLRTRYVKVAAALDEFHPVLVQTQAQARANLTVALAAHQDMQAAQTGVTQMNDFNYQAQQAAANQNKNLPAGKPPVQPATWTGPNYPAMLTDATTRFNNAKGQIDAAVQHFNGASQTAANQVNAASNDSLKNQSHGFSLGGFFGGLLKSWAGDAWHGIELGAHWVAQHVPLDAISDVLGKITLILAALSFIPGVGEVADALGLITGSLLLVVDTINAINAQYEGKFRWDNQGLGLGLDVLGVGVGAGAGKLLESLGKGGEAAEGAIKTGEDDERLAKGIHLIGRDVLKESLLALDKAEDVPKLTAKVFTDAAHLNSAIDAESAAVENAVAVKAANEALVKSSKSIVRGTQLGVRATGAALGAAGITNAVAGDDTLPAVHNPWDLVKNVVVNSTKADIKALTPLAKKVYEKEMAG